MDMSGNTVVTSGGSCGGLNIVPPTKSPERESETTPPRVQSAKPISFSNGVLKRHAPPQVVVVYKECLKNHAASLGGHALDGCGEFMPAPNATPSDPTSLKCAACGCHRNFHRRDPEEFTAASNITNTPPPTTLTHVIEYHPHHRHQPLPPPPPPPPGQGLNPARSPGSQSPPPISSSFFPGSAPHMLLALSSGGGAAVSGVPETANGPHHHQNNNNIIGQFQTHVMNSGSTSQPLLSPGSRKRFRTKFSQEQKEKMHEFAEKVGWKMQKTNEQMVVNFCNEIGVERGVFKVWMHNNKNTFAKRSNTIPSSSILPLSSGGAQSQSQAFNVNLHDDDDDDDDDDEEEDDDDDGDEIGNLNGNGNGNSHHGTQHVIHHHHNHHNNQQYNNGGKVSESNANAAPTNGSSSS